MTFSDALAQMIEDKLSDADAGGASSPQRSNGKGRLADHR